MRKDEQERGRVRKSGEEEEEGSRMKRMMMMMMMKGMRAQWGEDEENKDGLAVM